MAILCYAYLVEVQQVELKMQNDELYRVEVLLGLILDQLKVGVDYHSVMVLLLEEDDLVILTYRGVASQEDLVGQRIRLEDWPLSQEVLNRQEPVIIPNIYGDSPLAHTFQQMTDERLSSIFSLTCSWLGVPLIVKKWTIGLLVLTHSQPDYYTSCQAELALAFAHHAAVALENDRLYRQVHHLAAQTERERLARAMHDQLAQAISYINLEASISAELLASGQIDQARTHLLELKQVAESTYTDVREAIFSLRTEVPVGAEFLPKLRDYLIKYESQYSIGVQLIVKDDYLARFPADVGIQIIRIIQEALTNVRKHAGASQVIIHFDQENNQVCITLEDNGQGFDPQQGRGEDQLSFGLQIMRERAESVNGMMEVSSSPGLGTHLLIRVPLIPGR